jgi:hypothetical protein
MNGVAFLKEATLLKPDTYRRYAAECMRIASKMGAKDRKTLLEIAQAWEVRAQEAERALPVPPKPKLDGGDMASS